MSKFSIGFIVGLSCLTFLAAGCAKKELVKEGGEANVAPVTQQTEKQAKPEMKEEVVQEKTVKEAPSSVAEENTSQGTQLVSLDNVYFDFDSYVLSSQSRDTLAKNAELIKKNGSFNVQIAGNCDERGSDEYNLALGEKRAKAAQNYLTTMGISSSRLSTISYGKEKPIDPGHDEAAWAKNRNDQFTIIVK
jgi:peptidoglycan-associated lipoprotein